MEEAVCAVKNQRLLGFQDTTEMYGNIRERLNCMLHIGSL